MADDPPGGAAQRLDRFLWFARLAKTRAVAQALCAAGHIRLDGRRVDRAHALVRPGSVLSLMVHGHVRVLRIEQLPLRRGPAAEAAALYREIPPAAPSKEQIDGSESGQ